MHSITQVSCRFGLIVDLLGISPTAFHLILLSFKHITIILVARVCVLLALKLNRFTSATSCCCCYLFRRTVLLYFFAKYLVLNYSEHSTLHSQRKRSLYLRVCVSLLIEATLRLFNCVAMTVAVVVIGVIGSCGFEIKVN